MAIIGNAKKAIIRMETDVVKLDINKMEEI